jgi:hypothetical protein
MRLSRLIGSAPAGVGRSPCPQGWGRQIGVYKGANEMKFIKTYAMILVLCYIFVLFGGWMLFDFSKHPYVAITACAFIMAVVASVFMKQEERIEQLEKRVKELEEKG